MKDKDDFWSLDRILPRKTPQYNSLQNVETVNVNVKNGVSSSDVDIQALFTAISENKSLNSVEDAIVKENDYLHFIDSNVMIYAYVGSYNNLMSYENKIRSSALALFDRKSEGECNFVEYFSFKPSFEELSEDQLKYYLYWRDDVRAGVFQKTSDSYALLLISEIVNLPDKISPTHGIEILIELWNKCFDNKRYDKLVADTIFEYCIVHNLLIPFEKLAKPLLRIKQPISNMLSLLYVFDYLLFKKSKLSNVELDYIFKNALGYSFDSSKHYNTNPELKKLMDLHFYDILGDFLEANSSYLFDIFDRHKKRTSGLKVIKPAFLYVNTSSEIKRNIVYEYYPFEKNDIELEALINIAKYIENKFRSECGIRARLAVSQILPDIRSCVDKAVALILHSSVNRVSGYASTTPVKKIIKVDISRAQNIEENSWQTTRMLTEGIDTFFDDEVEEMSEEVVEENVFDDLELDVLELISNEKVIEAKNYCENRGMFLDSVLTALNEKFFDTFGDTIIDLQGLKIYDDYLDDVVMYLTRSKNESK